MSNIKVSEKHGLNPSLDICFWCGEPKGVILAGRLPNDAEAPKGMICDYDCCDACRDKMAQGITFIEVTMAPNGSNQPKFGGAYPTGRWWVLKEEAVTENLVDGDLKDRILKVRKAFVTPEDAEQLGLV